MRKHNQIYILGAPHYKAHFRFLRNLQRVLSAPYGPKNTVIALISLQASICLPRSQKPVGECCVIELFMGTIVEWYEYCPLLAAFGGLPILRKGRSNNLGFRNLAKLQNSSVDF